MYVIIDENKKVLASATAPVGDSWFGLPWTETDKDVIRGMDGALYFAGELPDGVKEQPKEEF